MTFVNTLAGWYVRFVAGFSMIAIFIGMINFGMILVTMLTVRGIEVPVWFAGIAFVCVMATCTWVGYTFEKYHVWDSITSHQNQTMNPEIREVITLLKKISDKVEAEK
jgi:hypothetical protein